MADKDYSQLTSATTIVDSDLLAIYPTGGPLKKVTFEVFKGLVITALGGTYLTCANNLSDLVSASAARANLGLGTASALNSGALFQVANNLSEVQNAATARTNIGAAASNAATLTGGVTQAGSTKQNVQAVASASLNLTLTDFFTKTVSTATTFTFDNPVASTAQAFLLELTIGSGAEVTWPASVEWSGGEAPELGDGKHLVGFVTFNGGTSWTGVLGAVYIA